MKLSVITVTFNAEAHIEQTLKSVASQSYSHVEHIIWDGGSRDQTLEIAARYPVTIYKGKDEGISDAMNKGAAKATGDFLIHLHADDCFAHDKVLDYIATTLVQHPCFDWLYGMATIIDGRGQFVRQTPFEHYSFKRLCKYNFITHPATVVSRKLFEKVGGFDTSLKYCMDYDLWLRLSKISAPFALYTPLACFREHEGSLSTSHPSGVADEAYHVRGRYLTSPIEKIRSYRTWKKRATL